MLNILFILFYFLPIYRNCLSKLVKPSEITYLNVHCWHRNAETTRYIVSFSKQRKIFKKTTRIA